MANRWGIRFKEFETAAATGLGGASVTLFTLSLAKAGIERALTYRETRQLYFCDKLAAFFALVEDRGRERSPWS